jgi:hypothetical protein
MSFENLIVSVKNDDGTLYVEFDPEALEAVPPSTRVGISIMHDPAYSTVRHVNAFGALFDQNDFAWVDTADAIAARIRRNDDGSHPNSLGIGLNNIESGALSVHYADISSFSSVEYYSYEF